MSPGKKNQINVVVEIHSGATDKVEYNEEGGYFELDRSLYSAVYYPFEYGFIPQTKSPDGDALDVVLLTTHPTFPGCVIKAKPIGVLMMKDENGRDDKIIAVPISKVDPRFDGIKEVKDLAKHLKVEIRQFMLDYKRLEQNKKVRIIGWEGSDEAKNMIEKAIKNYRSEKNVSTHNS
ncbi:MAG: inorganic diphosphatase [Candidatus Diapherotrites archaeon]|nr:inorganic diphosphatase [Candidatus Diapherotrites archaeon]